MDESEDTMNKTYTPTEIATLNRSGFTQTMPVALRRAIISVEGLEKTGKTHFALTAEGDVSYISVDVGLEGMVNKFLAQGKRIYTLDVPSVASLVMEFDQNKAQDVFAKLKLAYQAALNLGGTIVIDTATEVWELLRLARFGKLANIMPNQYGPVNMEYRDLIRRAFDAPNVTLILLHKMKEEYVGSNRTGNYKRSGFSETGYLVQLVLECYRMGNDFGVRVKECRHKASLTGLELFGPMATMPTLMDMLHS
jgi:hypothetical protein